MSEQTKSISKVDFRKLAGVKIEAGDTVRTGLWTATVIKAGDKMSKIQHHNTQAICWMNNSSLIIVQ